MNIQIDNLYRRHSFIFIFDLRNDQAHVAKYIGFNGRVGVQLDTIILADGFLKVIHQVIVPDPIDQFGGKGLGNMFYRKEKKIFGVRLHH